jgi:hypothetical protein
MSLERPVSIQYVAMLPMRRAGLQQLVPGRLILTITDHAAHASARYCKAMHEPTDAPEAMQAGAV